MPKLTIGMAHFDDFDGVYFTVQALRLYHTNVMPDVELVVVDNNPNSILGQAVGEFIGSHPQGTGGGMKYVELESPSGTSPSRNHIFKVASGDYVLVMDCHVMLVPGALESLMAYYEANPDTSDLLTGPLLYDNMSQISTHFDDQWQSEMWGTWGTAWKCGCGDGGIVFSLKPSGGNNPITQPRLLGPGYVPIESCGACKKKLPVVPWGGHETSYYKEGFRMYGMNKEDEPIEIPGQGLGMFSCRREAWLGFNPDARGFGGEELYIHGKFREAGHKAMCLPSVKWLHRFGRPSGVKYPLTRWNKIRNYVLEFSEMGWPLDPIHEHFVASGLMSEDHWKILSDDPISAASEPGDGSAGCGGCGVGAAHPNFDFVESPEDAFNHVKEIPRDLDQHMPKLKELAEQVDHVTEFSGRRESAVALLAGLPKTLISHNGEPDALLKRLESLPLEGTNFKLMDSLYAKEIEKTDLLFLDTEHTFDRLLTELLQFGSQSTKRFIVMHDTQIHGEKGSDGGRGLLDAVATFLTEFPEWSVIYHTVEQYGLTVLGKLKKDKPKLPSKIKMAANLTKALADHVSTGGGATPKDEYKKRLEACTVCDQRVDNRCAVCGCFLDKKAAMKNQDCPLSRWPKGDS
jgi:glycosyltransferase involved in cell wall biosynthesis